MPRRSPRTYTVGGRRRKYWVQKSVKRKGALTRLAKHYGALNEDGTINHARLKSHYGSMTTLQKEEFNFYERTRHFKH